VYNTISAELEKFYQEALNLAWQQIDPSEMKTVAEQAKKADKDSNDCYSRKKRQNLGKPHCNIVACPDL
jgi:hypothetical protein